MNDEIFKKEKQISKSVLFKRDTWETFKKVTKKNKHKIKEAMEYGIQCYLEKYSK